MRERRIAQNAGGDFLAPITHPMAPFAVSGESLKGGHDGVGGVADNHRKRLPWEGGIVWHCLGDAFKRGVEPVQ